VPLRDFYAYDPGRYLWTAAGALLFGDDLRALRLSLAIFGAVGLTCGLLAARRAVRSWPALALVGCLLALWMVPRQKIFEPAIALVLVWGGVRLLERPSPGRHAAAGALVGLATLFGKNLGLYAAAAYLALVLLVHLRGAAPRGGLARGLVAGLAGLAAGSVPLLVLLAAVPRFFASYLDSIRFFVYEGRTNFPLPIPWPWRLGAPALSAQYAAMLGKGCTFVAMLLVYGTIAVLALRTKGEEIRDRALLLAAGAVGAAYFHHALSRADLGHLAPSAPPFLLAALALPPALPAGARRAAWAAIAALLAFLSFAPLSTHPLYQRYDFERRGHPYREVEVAGNDLLLPHYLARFLRGVEQVVGRHVPPAEPVLMVPDLVGLYPMLRRPSPVFDIYPIWPARGGADARMLREMKERNVRWVLFRDFSVDERPELRFPLTHPQVWSYLQTGFRAVEPQRLALFKTVLLERRAP
jgi:hypothetical protein